MLSQFSVLAGSVVTVIPLHRYEVGSFCSSIHTFFGLICDLQNVLLQIRKGNRNNLWIISHIYAAKHA